MSIQNQKCLVSACFMLKCLFNDAVFILYHFPVLNVCSMLYIYEYFLSCIQAPYIFRPGSSKLLFLISLITKTYVVGTQTNCLVELS